MVDRYGDFDLRRGSSHPEETQRLQRDLHELGFRLVGEPSGTFGRLTYWALREFQIYAAMDQVAKEDAAQETVYADRLSAVPTGAQRYDGPISGVANAGTRAALEHWLDSRWRCPVVVEAWSMKNRQRHGVTNGNLWRHDDLASNAPRMYARDLSGYYGPAVQGDADDRIVVGDYTKFSAWGGPRSVPPSHTVPQGELLPETLLGRPLDQLGAAERSTFKVIRAVSEVECLGYFDSVNSYDNAFVSVGPCHWTLGIASGDRNVAEGELCGYLAYLRHADAGAFDKAVGFFGARVDENWGTDGAALYNRSQRKYAGWVALQQEDGNFGRVPEREGDGDYFKTWHWFYRFVMAGRGVPGYRRRMWDMARMRLRDLQDLPWPGGGRLGDIFTSEKALAMVLRWHIRFPSHVAAGGRAGNRMTGAVQQARSRQPALGWDGAPAGWTDAHEAALIDALLAGSQQAGGGLPKTIAQVDAWPAWAGGSNRRGYTLDPTIGSLSRARGSLQFDTANLPPAP